jgi:hypothetical protein
MRALSCDVLPNARYDLRVLSIDPTPHEIRLAHEQLCARATAGTTSIGGVRAIYHASRGFDGGHLKQVTCALSTRGTKLHPYLRCDPRNEGGSTVNLLEHGPYDHRASTSLVDLAMRFAHHRYLTLNIRCRGGRACSHR